MKSKIDGKKMTAMFYDNDMLSIQTIHFGAEGYDDYTIPPHDANQQARYMKDAG